MTLLQFNLSFKSYVKYIKSGFRSLDNAGNLYSSKLPNSNTKILMLFSIKLGILSGITMGMMQISLLFQWNIVNMIFIIINSSLGIFIGILFNCNTRVWRLYQARMTSIPISNNLSTT